MEFSKVGWRHLRIWPGVCPTPKIVCEGGDGGTHNISANLLLQLLNNGVDMADAKPWPVVPAMSVGAENWNDARGLGESHYAKVQP